MAKKYALLIKTYPLITFFILWCMLICSFVICRVFGDNPPDISMGTATAFGTFFALPAIAVQLMKFRHNKGKDE